ncbi:(deoxy)nucleoside triphosphate pyrophosphohydrolase [Shewanella sp. KX20019]|uniref:(deoxy)nucleoside triphosphate pyrophosphohydrolase n=1 Tax=Shewanella sp. KX20019 TaxID=2803864 RepID=UPI001928B617|nr:(deoxy)nucleoside triphosphate pyrophosphohydrolase [Shewanella sp. KX20019]QQX81676.1 (deoxy)nucleoside triphosphate pyrophosphohydrolase [Shewanella sp. KX20019]
MKKQIEVVAAIIQRDGKYLAVQRGPAALDYISHKWEFPGGKVEAGESLKTAIERELYEELKVTVSGLKLLITVNHEYPDFHITMHCFLCHLDTTDITFTEHIDSRWLNSSELWDVDWAAADIPAVKKLT